MMLQYGYTSARKLFCAPFFLVTPSLALSCLHPPCLQEFGNLTDVMALDNNMLRHTVDLDLLVLLVEKDPQLIPQRRYISGNFSYRRQMQVASSLVIGVDGQILIR